MKFLCVSDQIDPLIYSAGIKERFNNVDAVLCAGDLPLDYVDFIVSSLNKPTFFVFGNHNLEDFHLYHRPAHTFTSESFNINSAGAEEAFKGFGHGADYVGFKSIRAKNLLVKNPVTGKETPLLIAGTSGSIRYNNGINQYTDIQMFIKLLLLVPSLLANKLRYGRYVDIFLTHAAPRKVHDLEDNCHKGFSCFNWFIKKFRPSYLVHGHIHLYDSRAERVTDYEGTKVVNAFGYTVIELENNNG